MTNAKNMTTYGRANAMAQVASELNSSPYHPRDREPAGLAASPVKACCATRVR